MWTLPAMQAALGCAAATYDCSVPEKLSSGPSSSSLSLQASSSVSAEAQMHPAHAELVPSDVSGAAAGRARRKRAAQAAAAGQAIATPIALAPLQPFLPPPPPTRSRSEYESAEVSTSFGATKACFNSSHCTFPERCTLESPYRRYCSSNRHVTTPGRTLLGLTGAQEPGVFGCERCTSPIGLLDFGDVGEVGSNVCAATCALPNNSSSPDAVSETYQTSNCQVTCTFLPAFLYGSARIERSPYFVGVDYGARHLRGARPG